MSRLVLKRRSPRGAGERKTRRETITFWCGLLVVVISVLTFVFTIGAKWIESAPAHAKRPEGKVLVTQEYVLNAAEAAFTVNDGEGVQTLTSSPTVEATLLNRTSHRALVVQARVSIEAYATVRLCFSQGGGPVPPPNPYTIRLPTNPQSSEQVVEAPLHEQLGPEEVDRIALRFGADTAGIDGYALYRLHIQLHLYGEDKDLDLGRFALSMPGRIPTFSGYLPSENALLQQFTSGPFKQYRLQTTWCFKQNLASLHEILAGSARRAPALALFDQPVLASQWGQLQDHLPPRPAATRLLEEKQAEDAVYAAAQTGEPRFEAHIREQASDQLLAEASKRLESGASTYVEQSVRMALAIRRSQRGQVLLREIQQRMAQEHH